LPVKLIFMVRHGETKANEKGIEAGPLDYPLAKKGVKDVQFIAKLLSEAKVTDVYSSPIYRAVQTAKILARPHRLKVRILEELTEAKIRPEFVGKKGRHHILTDPEAYAETNRDLLERAQTAIQMIKNRSRGNAILVSHGDVIAALLEDVVERRLSTEKYYVLHPEPASLSIVEAGDRLFLVLYNYHRKMSADF
jgi:alpha-ribazole phosphatase/probable phosphoglycerate mutase